MRKYPKIKRCGHDQNQGMFENPDHQLIIKEKLDGANFRWTYDQDTGKPVFGSKNVEYRKNGEPVYTSDEYEKLDGRFTDAINHVKENVDADDLLAAGYNPSKLTFFAENMVSHSIQYDWENTPQIIGFDIHHEEKGFLPVEEVYEIYNEIGVVEAPIIMQTTVEEFKRKHESEDGFPIPDSQWRDGKGEGVVIINKDAEENQRSGFNTRAKLVTDEFAEKHKKATGANQSREAVHDHEKAVSKYCTDQRIRKRIHAMQNEGRELGMELMANQDGSDGLPIRVAKDIVQEEYPDFVTSNWTIDFKKFRDLIADRCVYVLRQEVQKL